ncbi:MAG: ArsR/SmtB family transcription factor [Desulfonatronovibrionaceae bacterium]
MLLDIQERYGPGAKIMKALGHPTRLFIVDTLSRQNRCVCELTEMIGADISTVSKHLSVLREAGVVTSEKRGTEVHYRLAAPCAADFFKCLDNMLKTGFKRQKRCFPDFAWD